MKTAEQIMKKKAAMRAEVGKHLPKEQADALWQQATEQLAAILKQYAGLPESMRFHTESRIFLSAAIYLTAKERPGEKTALEYAPPRWHRCLMSSGPLKGFRPGPT